MVLVGYELEGLRRSLAMGNGLPPDQIRRLIESHIELLARHRTVAQELETLRPVIVSLRAGLGRIHTATNQTPT
jgi:hypothetical protein